MYHSWVPWNTRPACTLSTNGTNSSHSCQGVQVPVQTWTPSPNTWDPVSVWCLNLHLIPTPKSQSGKSQNPWQESNKSFCSHKQVCAQDNKSVIWLPSTATDGPQSTQAEQVQSEPRSNAKPGPDLRYHSTRSPIIIHIYIPGDINIITTIISFLSLTSDRQSLDFYRSPVV